uniref:Methyltransferase FkbM domain-containing protein n=1 Tax=viral metagenome TaxID=1070528 RepID=A0A6C0DWR1_9ZZZZ
MDLNIYQKKVLSQWGQDGVLEAIFDKIGTTNKYFVEFGSSGNDSGMGNTAYLRRRGFSGLLMDGTEKPYGNDVMDRQYKVEIEFISASNVNNLFEKYNVPSEFDLLSIDIDGQDFHVWNALKGYNPRVVSIEMNYHMAPGKDLVLYYDDNFMWRGNERSGASVTALKHLGNKKGYSLVATCMSDAIFVRNDLIYDNNNSPLFLNINDEFELVKLNTDISLENKKYNMRDNHFDNMPEFYPSRKYL